MLASLLWAVGPVHFDEAKVPKQVHMWYDKPNGFFTTTDYFNTCAALRNSPLAPYPPTPHPVDLCGLPGRVRTSLATIKGVKTEVSSLDMGHSENRGPAAQHDCGRGALSSRLL